MLCATREYHTSAREAGVWNVLFRDEQPPRLVSHDPICRLKSTKDLGPFCVVQPVLKALIINPTLFLNGRTGLRTHIWFKFGERNIQHLTFCDDHRPLDHILQLPDIVGPVIPNERLHCFGRDGGDHAIVPPG
jgi:hypothetical protein